MQQTCDFLHKRLLIQEESHRDLLRVVKLLQHYNESQEGENARFKEHLRQTDKMVRLTEERGVNMRQWAEEFENRQIDKLVRMREDMVRDMKAIGKELALDIVALNKKIDSRTQQIIERVAGQEGAIRKSEHRVHKIMKQYN